ncbi:MAG: hypothetical protein OCU22_09335 [Canidatus Methanoxibalbensis ujae]|nr:hypothetical protein [Candidatus Methanoxibalbensis ujae]
MVNAVDDILRRLDNKEADETRERMKAKALIVFFYAEMYRHLKDIEHILNHINRLRVRFGFTEEELRKLEEESKEYVEF